MFTQNQIRQQYIEFFKSKGHHYTPGCSLVPAGDPTLLFINSGMAQFKDVFLGLKDPEKVRVCNSQKCIRLSGKHNDLEEVGYDTYHHTFFEMLGNWSFGDYYKKEAIEWAWELLTEVWKLPKDKLYATVYTTDDEAFELWKTVTDIGEEKILHFGDKDNFWEMAEVGPCGPCSEIHIDVGAEFCTCQGEQKTKCGIAGGGVNMDCPRYIEIWNLVFIQYNREADRSLTPLDKVHVDTGMGFERICAVLQKAKSNYETDVFSPLIKHLEKISGKTYNTDSDHTTDLNQVAFRVIVDHIRTISFSIADGVIPSNEGRGYVMRRVLRRAYRYGRELGFNTPFLHTFIDILDESFGDFFPEIRQQKDLIKKIILKEEEMFDLTLSKGLALFHKMLEGLTGKTISGKIAFELYDTYGFPFDLTLLLAKEKNLVVDEKEFRNLLTQQREVSKKGKKSIGKYELLSLFKNLNLNTRYTGDHQHHETGKLERIIVDGTFQDKLAAGKSGILILDQTCFYAESGGQVGDQGEIFDSEGNLFKVEDCQKIETIFLLYGKVEKGEMVSGKSYQQSYDLIRRNAIRKNHTATHLMHQALIENLGNHVRQSGSLVNEHKLRFDFNHFEPIETKILEKIEARVNEVISQNLPVTAEEMSMAAATKKNAKAFFEEKYGDVVRVMTVGEEDIYSTELCGGSHVSHTGEIGGFKIIHESSSSSGIRRIEAITGPEIIQQFIAQSSTLEEIKQQLRVDHPDQINPAIEKLKSEIEQLKQKAKQGGGQGNLVNELKNKRTPLKNGAVNFYSHEVKDEDLDHLSHQLDQLRNQDPQAIIALGNVMGDKITLLVGVGKDLIGQFHAGELVKILATHCGGNGGGKPTFAQAGGKQPEKFGEAVELVKKKLSE